MGRRTNTDPLYTDPDFSQFYDRNDDTRPDIKFCTALAEQCSTVLDLGCGTGAFLTRLNATKTLVGVDPAQAMLNIAKTRSGGGAVKWLCADAR